jgi:hypothetical protein
VSREQVAAAIESRVGISRSIFSVHRYRPEDFLVVFANDDLKVRVMAWNPLQYEGFSLYFRQWTRQAQFQSCVMQSKVRLAIEGILPHAWDLEIVQLLLGTSCSLLDMAPEMACRADLGFFKIEAWTIDPEGIPPEHELWVPEPAEGLSLVGPLPSGCNKKLVC